MTFSRRAAERCTDAFARIRRRGPVAGLTALLALTAGACGGLGEAMTAHTDVVARAAGKELRVEEAAALLASNPRIPADPQVVRALADLWVDYTLLATAVAEDSSLSTLDLEAFTRPARDQALVLKLREQVIQADTTFTEPEIAQRWQTEAPGLEVRARHILLQVPPDATEAQRDSIRALAESLRQRAVGGADFAALAREYSQDPGSAQEGGDLGFFGRGRMVAPFEEAAFQLEPGDISPVVESPFGYHVIRMEERRQPELGEQREQFRQFLVAQAQQEAEMAYLDSISEAANIQVAEGGLEVIREIAGRPGQRLRGRAANRPIATYDGGAFTSGEFLEFVRSQPAQVQSMFTNAADDQLREVVEQLTRMELLLAQAESRDIQLTGTDQEEIRSEARNAIRQLLQETGLAAVAGANAGAATIDARVEALLRGYIAGETQLPPLGRFGFVLRDRYPAEINESAFPAVVEHLEAVRAAQPQAPEGVGGIPGAPGQPGAPGMPGSQPGTQPGAQPGTQPGVQPGAAPPQPAQEGPAPPQ